MRLIKDDCLHAMDELIKEGVKVDAVITDMPYGITACKWDNVIPFEPMWERLNKLIKENGAIVLFGSEPFSSKLRMSNLKMYKYDWVWKKSRIVGFLNAKCRPMHCLEDIIVFSKKTARAKGDNMIYNPQGLIEINKTKIDKHKIDNEHNLGRKNRLEKSYLQKYTNYPKDLLEFKQDNKVLHPTQKPLALMEYLVKTYTNEGETVLDFTMGSGTTGVACKNLNRHFIGIELDENYFNIAKERIEKN